MGTRTKRGIRLGLMAVLFAVLFIVVSAIPGVATPTLPDNLAFKSERLGHGNLAHGSLAVKPGLQVVVAKNTVQPGASSGWHSHPGGAIVVVDSGQITTYVVAKNDDEGEGDSSKCIKTDYGAGQAFIERPGQVLNARNNGSSVTTIYATFPGVPVDTAGNTLQRTDRPAPNPNPCRV
jgi:hypothetical protein